MRHPNLLLTAALLASLHTSAQEQFIYKREVANVPAEGWYSLLLPSDIFGKLNPAFGDLRLFEVERSDTVEIPYMLEIRSEESVRKEEALKLLNSGYHNGALVMTFEAKPGQKVNHLDLSFEEKDFFGFVTIEGSDRRDEWVLIAEDLRIVSLEQADGNLDLTAITFPATDHRYLRLRLRSDKKLKFKGARFSLQTTQPGVYNKLPATWNATVNEKVKHTYVHIRLDEQVPVEYLALKIDSARDYYRPFTLEYVRDSSQTDKGWIKHYSPLLRGHLTSYVQNKFRFPRQVAKELRLAILDRDNAPLNIRELSNTVPSVSLPV